MFPLSSLWHVPQLREDATLSSARVYRFLDQIPEVGQAVGAKFLQPVSKSVIFESVGYSLPRQRQLLNNFDLRITAGEAVAFVSLDPLESRAVAYMLPRFIEPQMGRVLIDGEDIAWVTLESLRAEAVYVGGPDPFFTGTVLENITCGVSDYTVPEATEAAKQMHAHKFILGLPQGYETQLGQGGEILEPGPSFRLSLARAMVRNPALIILEEPPELDADTKALLDDAYKRLKENRTVIFLPSRLSTVRRVDRIVLIHDGRVEAIGTHESLVHSSALYRHWEYVRFNQFRSQPV